MNRRHLVVGKAVAIRLSLAAAALGLSACANPFHTVRSDFGRVIPVERLRTIATLSLADHVVETLEERLANDETMLPREIVDPFKGYEELEISIEQTRVWTLENNLDLQVKLIDPTIARERLSQEEAKFESTFTFSIQHRNVKSPTSSTLSSNVAEITSATPGVTIPLRTGGTITVDLPLNRTETNNSFTTLNPSYSSDARFSISQPLLRNAGRRANTHSIRIQAFESQIAEAQAKLEVIRQIVEADRAYWLLYAGQRQLVVTQEQYELAIEQLERAERRVRAQVAPEVEITRAQDGVASRLEDIIIAENRVRQRQRNLKRIINVAGIEMGTELKFVLTTQPDPVRYDLNAEELTVAAVGNRMEMLELELRLAQDFSTIDFEKNQLLPNFVMDFEYRPQGLGDSTSNSLDVLQRATFRTWQVGANLDVPLGNEAAEGRVHQAILRRLQRLASKANRTLSIRQEVYDAVDELNASWQRILAARQASILAARTMLAEQNQFNVGVRTSTDVLDAATRLADAQSAEIIALTTYQIAQVDLAFATGTLLGQAKVDWSPRDPRGPDDFVGERSGRVPLGPPGVSVPDSE